MHIFTKTSHKNYKFKSRHFNKKPQTVNYIRTLISKFKLMIRQSQKPNQTHNLNLAYCAISNTESFRQIRQPKPYTIKILIYIF